MPKGEWHIFEIEGDMAYYAECPSCGYRYGCGNRRFSTIKEKIEIHNFCPDCGADMRGEYNA